MRTRRLLPLRRVAAFTLRLSGALSACDIDLR